MANNLQKIKINWTPNGETKQVSNLCSMQGGRGVYSLFQLIKNEMDNHWYPYALDQQTLQYNSMQNRFLSLKEAKEFCEVYYNQQQGTINMSDYVSLSAFIACRTELSEVHLIALKRMLAGGLRSQAKKNALERMTLTTLRLKKDQPQYARVHFDANGRCDLAAGQDYPSELRKVRDLLLT
jgi:hypothetical protein